MTSEIDPDLERVVHAQIRDLQAVIAKVSQDYSGHPTQEVRDAVQREVDALGNGATIVDPELSFGAQAVSEGKHLRLSDEGKLLTED
jgi:hypothetical protein